MPEDASQNEHLSTVGKIDPVTIIGLFKSQDILLIAIETEARERGTGFLQEKGGWIRKLWHRVLEEMPKAEGCRLLWNRVFFAFDAQDTEDIRVKFRKILQELSNPLLESRCLMSEASGTPEDKVQTLDRLEHDLGSKADFDSSRYLHCRLRDGRDFDPPGSEL